MPFAVTAQTASHTESGLTADAAAKVIAKAVTVSKPRTRYTTGREAALVTLLRIAPDRVVDRLLAAALRPYYPEDRPTIRRRWWSVPGRWNR
jgi:hypothetical protein